MIYRSRFPDIRVPSVSLTGHVLADAGRRGAKPALIDGVTGKALTYRELDSGVRSGVVTLRERGVQLGDVVALLAVNQPDWAVAFHATVAAGAVIIPVSPALTAGEISHQLNRSRARVLIAGAETIDKVQAAVADTGITTILTLADERARFTAVLDLTPGSAPVVRRLDAGSNVAALPFSSGTTGQPKPVMLTHRNLVANLEQFRPVCRLTDRDVLCAVLPFFHIYGLTLILNAGLMAGSTIVTLPRYDLLQLLTVIERHRVTRLHLVPPIVLDLAQAPGLERYDLSSLSGAICGAAPLDEAVADRAARRLGCPIGQGYGMTEASPSTHVTPDDELGVLPAGSVGRLMPSTRARIVDPVSGRDTTDAGELWVNGPQVMAGYLDDTAATAATVQDGWLRTGDLVRVNDDGVFWVIDRIKELIKYNGYQVSPAELEAVLLAHPAVKDAAVTGMPHTRGGEAPVAFVVPGEPLSEPELMTWAAERLAPYKRIRAVKFVDSLPRSASGKLLRRRLSEMEAGADG